MAIKPKGKKVTGTKKADKITWTSSKPWKKALTVDAGAGNDVINFKKSNYNNVLKGGNGNDKIYGGKKVDKIYGGKGNDKLYGYAGNDIIKAGAGKDYIDGGAGNDKLYGESGTNTLKGGAGNDKIYGGTGTDYIYGGAGNDFIYAGNGTNNIYGEAGDDIIYANKGTNNVYINKGQGNDKIRGIETSTKLNLNLGTGLAAVYVYKNGSNYMIERKYSETVSEFTTLENFNYDAAKDKVSVIYNGNTVTLSSLFIPNYDPANSKVTNLGEEGGSYEAQTSELNQIVYGGAGDDIIKTKDSNDYIDAGEGNNNVSITGGNNTVVTGSGNDTIKVYGSGTNTIESTGGNDSINAAGSVNITTGAGNDTIFFDGNSTSTSNINAGEGNNSITGNTAGEATIRSGAGDDSISVYSTGTYNINLGTGEDTIRVSSGTNTIDMRGADGGYYKATGGNNTVYGGANNNTYELAGGNTNLTVDNHEGMQEYTISGGQNTISGNGYDVDKVTISGGEYHEVTTGGGNDSISVTGGSNSYVETGVDNDKVTIGSGASGTTVNAGAGNDSITSSGSGNVLFGGQGRDDINVNNANGNSTIYGGEKPSTPTGEYTGADTDYNIINAANTYDNKIWAGNGLSTTDGGQSYIKGDSIWAGYNGNGNNTIYGGNGNDYIQADGSREAFVTGGKGNDTIYSGSYRSTVDGGEGNDTIYIYSSSYGSIRGGDGDDYISSPYGSGASGTADIWGDKGNDSISVSYGSYSANIHFKKGDGSDTIDGGYGKTEAHTLVFDDVNADEITTHVNTSGHLTITYGNGDSIYVEGFANYNSDTQNNSVAYIKTADMDSSMNLKDFVNTHSIHQMTTEEATDDYYGTYFNDNITGTSANDTIHGDYGDDTLNGGIGNDTLYGEGGNDRLNGDAGDDYFYDYQGNNTMVGGRGNDSFAGSVNSGGSNTLYFYQGDGVDTISSAGNYDNLFFEVNSLNDITVEYDVENQAIALRYSANDKVILTQNGSHNEYNVNIGKLSDLNTTQSLNTFMYNRNIVMVAREYYPYVSGDSDPEHFYIADSGHSTIYGGGGNDTITSVGRVGDNGKFTYIDYVDYMFNNYGDGHDTIENTNSYFSSYIDFLGVNNSAQSQQNFVDELKYTLSVDNTDPSNPRYDLVITYGTNSSITIKDYNPENPVTNLEGVRFAYYNYDTEEFDFSVAYSFSNNLHITRNENGTETNIMGANYNELIWGTDGDDTINPGPGNNIIKPKGGADVIEITKQYADGELQCTTNTLFMGTDGLPDTIWLKDVTDPENEISIYKNDNDLQINLYYRYYDEEYHTYRQDLYSSVCLKDYFSYVELDDNEPTYMNIKIGNGDSVINTTIRDLYYYSFDNTGDEPRTWIEGTLLPDNIATSPDVAEQVHTGAGNDTICAYDDYSDPQADSIYAGDGDDLIDYSLWGNGNANVRLYGEAGNDTIYLSEGTAYGGTGNDSIEAESYEKNDGTDSGVTIYGGTGVDSLDSADDMDTLKGDDGDDVIYGSKGRDYIDGWSGDDYIDGGAGDDTIVGERGTNTIYGGEGNDLIYTSDSISGVQGGTDGYQTEVHAGIGDDTIYLSDTDANVWGDAGNDLFISSHYASTTYHIKKNEGNDTIVASDRTYSNSIDKLKFDDLDFDTDEVAAELDLENNRVIVYYNKVDDEFLNYVTLDHYFKPREGTSTGTYDKYGFEEYEPGSYHYEYDDVSDVYCSLDTIIDKNGKEKSIRSLITMPASSGADAAATVFSDSITLTTESSNNTYSLKSGDDTLTTSTAYYSYTIYGNDGNDSIIGNSKDDYLHGDDGDDYLDGKGGGENDLYGGEGNDTLVAGSGKTKDDEQDQLYGEKGSNVYDIKLPSGGTKDTTHAADVYSISNTDRYNFNITRSNIGSSDDNAMFKLYKGSDEDLVIRYSMYNNGRPQGFIEVKDWFINPLDSRVSFQNTDEMSMFDAIRAYWDNDWADALSGSLADFVSGNNSFRYHNGASLIFGTSYNDTIGDTYGIQTGSTPLNIYAGAGNDSITVQNNSGTANVYGGEGNDIIRAVYGVGVYIDGGMGNDSITTENGSDTIFGGYGADTIEGQGGSDVIFTGVRPMDYHYNVIDDMDIVLQYANAANWYNYDFTKLEDAGEITNTVISAYGNTTKATAIYSIGENTSIILGYGDKDVHVSLSNNTTVSDVFTSSGTNNLYIHHLDGRSNAAIFMNITQGGAIDGDIYLSNIYDMRDNWLANGGEFDYTDEDLAGVITLKNGVDTFNKITYMYTSQDSYLTKSDINTFVADIASWLKSDGRDYADVKAALASEDANALMNKFWAFNYEYNPDNGWTNHS